MSGLSVWSISLVAVFALVMIGLYGLLILRNLIKMVVALQVFAKGTILVMVVAGGMQGQIGVGRASRSRSSSRTRW